MTAPNYPACLKQMLVYEGGYSNHPSDPGGVTLEGVIQTRYNEYRRAKGKPLKALTPQMRYTKEWIAERNEIYRIYYWDVVKGDSLPDGVDLAVFDYGVNSGPCRALAHSKPYAAFKPIPRIKGICGRRLSFVRGLRTWAVFGKGWGPRIANVEAVGVKMALKAANVPTAEIKEELETEAGRARTTSNAGAGGATAGGAGGGAAAAQADWSWLFIGSLTVFTIAIVGGGAWIWWKHRERAKAYLDVARGMIGV